MNGFVHSAQSEVKNISTHNDHLISEYILKKCIVTFSHESQNIACKVRRAVWQALDATLGGNNYS